MAVRKCALSLLAQVNAACGGDQDGSGLARQSDGLRELRAGIRRSAKALNRASGFPDVEVLDEAGLRERSAVGVAVEIEGVFQIG